MLPHQATCGEPGVTSALGPSLHLARQIFEHIVLGINSILAEEDYYDIYRHMNRGPRKAMLLRDHSPRSFDALRTDALRAPQTSLFRRKFPCSPDENSLFRNTREFVR